MRLKIKVLALMLLAMLVVSTAAVGVASAQAVKQSYNTNLTIMGQCQVTQPGTTIKVGGMFASSYLQSGISGPVKVYIVRTDPGALFEGGWRPQLVATVADWNAAPTQVSFNTPGDYYVYAKFDGATGADGNYYRPSQSGMMEVKVTNTPGSLTRVPSLLFMDLSPNNHQTATVGSTFQVGGQFRSWGAKSDLTTIEGRTISVYMQYKQPGSQFWGAPKHVGDSVTEPHGVWWVTYTPKQPGEYRFQAIFAGDPAKSVPRYDPSVSNYVGVTVVSTT